MSRRRRHRRRFDERRERLGAAHPARRASKQKSFLRVLARVARRRARERDGGRDAVSVAPSLDGVAAAISLARASSSDAREDAQKRFLLRRASSGMRGAEALATFVEPPAMATATRHKLGGARARWRDWRRDGRAMDERWGDARVDG